MPLTFVGGIHGSGKSSLCAELVAQAGVQHLTAGALIREGLGMATLASGASRAVDNVDKNQQALLSALAKRRLTMGHFVLDGHFALLTSAGAIEEVPLAVFQEIAPTALLVVTVEPEVAAARLEKRDGHRYEPALLAELQHRELLHAASVERTFGAKLMLVGSDTPTDDIIAFLRSAEHG